MEHGLDPFAFDEFTGLRSDPNVYIETHKLQVIRYALEVHGAWEPSKYYTKDVRNLLRSYYYSSLNPLPYLAMLLSISEEGM